MKRLSWLILRRRRRKIEGCWRFFRIGIWRNGWFMTIIIGNKGLRCIRKSSNLIIKKKIKKLIIDCLFSMIWNWMLIEKEGKRKREGKNLSCPMGKNKSDCVWFSTMFERFNSEVLYFYEHFRQSDSFSSLELHLILTSLMFFHLLRVFFHESAMKLSVSGTYWCKSLYNFFILVIIRVISSLIWRWSPEISLFLPPTSLPWITSSSLPLLFASYILIKPAWILRPLNIESKSTEIQILKSLFSLLSTSFTLKLYKSISFLNYLQYLPSNLFCNSHTIWMRPRIIASLLS